MERRDFVKLATLILGAAAIPTAFGRHPLLQDLIDKAKKADVEGVKSALALIHGQERISPEVIRDTLNEALLYAISPRGWPDDVISVPAQPPEVERRTQIVKLLLDENADANYRRNDTRAYNKGISALHVAAELGYVDIMQELMNKGADKDASYKATEAGTTCTIGVTTVATPEARALLLDRGAKIIQQPSPTCPGPR